MLLSTGNVLDAKQQAAFALNTYIQLTLLIAFSPTLCVYLSLKSSK